MRPHGKESSWDPRDVGGTVMPTWRVGDWCCCGGTIYAHVMLLLWGATSCVGWEWWDRTMKIGSGWYKEIESNGLGFYAEKPSPLDSVSTQRNQVHWTRFLLKKRVHWTCFLCIETEFIGLDFYAEKTESFGLVFCLRFFVREPLSSCRNRALFTRIVKNQNSLKRFLSNDIVWVLLLFSKKNQNFMAYFWAFGLFCFHVAFIHIKTGENRRITNGRGARPKL